MTNLNLDENLISKDSPAINQTNSYEFNSVNDKNIIGDYNLGTFTANKIVAGTIDAGSIAVTNLNASNITSGTMSFNRASGGTLVLGGTTNGNGLMEVRNAAGGTVITMDNTGITVNDGSIVVKNSGSVTLLDNVGLVSAANFPFTIVSGTAGQQTANGTAWVDITGMTTDIVLTRAQQIYFFCKFRGGDTEGDITTTNAPNCKVRLLVGGTEIDTTSMPSAVRDDGAGGVSFHFTVGAISAVVTVAAGTTTAKMQFSSTSSGKEVRTSAADSELVYFKLGA